MPHFDPDRNSLLKVSCIKGLAPRDDTIFESEDNELHYEVAVGQHAPEGRASSLSPLLPTRQEVNI